MIHTRLTVTYRFDLPHQKYVSKGKNHIIR